MSADITTGTSADEVADEIQPLLDLVGPALSVGAASAGAFFARENELVDRYLHPGLVRWYAKRWLRSQGQTVQDEEDNDVLVAGYDLANNGLQMSFKDLQLRILKSDEGQLPVPESSTKQGYYNQQLSMRFLEDGSAGSFRMNLVLLWDVDPDSRISRMTLVYPRSGGRSRATVTEYWRFELPVPSQTTIAREEAEIEIEDLPITLVAKKEDETQQKPG